MSVFVAATPSVELPVTSSGDAPAEGVHRAVILDLFDAEPWIVACERCTIVSGTSSRQDGCAACRGRGWFNDITGLPVKLWWWQSDPAAAANWLVHTVLPTMLRAVGWVTDAEMVEGMPKLTAERLRKRVAGVGALEETTGRVAAAARALLPSGEHGGWITPQDWADRSHHAWTLVSDARYDFIVSRLGDRAYMLAIEVANLVRARRDHETTDVDLDALLDDLVADYEQQVSGAYMIEEDVILGPARPRLHQDRSVRCESRVQCAGELVQCEIVDPPRGDSHHRAITRDGEARWLDDENVAVTCPATLTITNMAGDPEVVRCVDHLYGHMEKHDGVRDHHWEGPLPADRDDYPDIRFWTDQDVELAGQR